MLKTIMGQILILLKVGMVCVDEAATLKRISPRAKGRANRICKRTCHITIKVSDEE